MQAALAKDKVHIA